MPTHYALVRVFIVLFLVGMVNRAVAQCDFVFDQDIPDNGTIVLELEVDDLVFDDLSSGQAVCGINLKFKHDYVGDLTIELTSPGGQTVKLVGPVTDQISPTNLTTWDVGFRPCLSVVVPDGLFSDRWDNNQNWQVFASYTGTYYPSSGCLEDFDTGSANGMWVLTLTDADLTATGKLLSVELIFCDNTGLICNICDADAGKFDLSDILICEDESVPDSTFIPEFGQDIPDPDANNYAYLVSSNNISYTVQSVLSGAGWPVGSYTICGMSYGIVDSSKLFEQLDSMTFAEIQSAFQNDAIDHCAELSTPCIRFIVYAIPDTTKLVESICQGSVFQVGDEVFSQAGDYEIDLVSFGGCDSVVLLNLSVTQVSARIIQLDTLSCEDQSTVLSAGGSVVPGTPLYSWSTVSGIIVGASNQPVLIIGSSGVYTVTVTDFESGCTNAKSWEAVTDGTEPFVQLADGVISCRDTVYTFEPIVFPLYVSFNWSGPSGFTDTVQNPNVTESGLYFLTVTDEEGCVAFAKAELSYDTLLSIDPGIRVVVDCIADKTVVIGDPGGPQEYSWTGPAGFASTSRATVTPSPGTYIVGITQLNGCVAYDSINVTHDYTIPDINITATADSINCGESITLSATSSLTQTIFNWSGSGLSITDTSQIGATSPGEYVVEGIAPNLCQAYDTLTLLPGVGLADVLTFTDTITCNKDTVSIGVVSLGQVISYRWTGPGMIDSTLSFIRVMAGGIYKVEMMDITGCIQRASVEVILNTVRIDFRFISDTITCNQPIANLTFAANRSVSYFEWLLPNSQIITDSIISVATGDRYTLTVTGENGCPRVRKIRVPIDTLKPLFFIEPAFYGCYDSVQLLTYFPDSVESQQWTGPDGFVSDTPDPYIYGVGNYTLTASGMNGCVGSKDIVVVPDEAPPIIMTTSELLDCVDSTAVLEISSPDTMVTYQWFFMGIQLSDSSSMTVNSPGQYRVVATASNNCQSYDTLGVDPPVAPSVFANEDTLNCRDTSVELYANSDSSNVSFTWFDDQGDNIGVGPTISVISPGTYNLTGEWTNGCSFDTTVVVYIDTMRPIAVATTSEVIKCLIQDIYLNSEASIGDSLLYRWSTSDGNILIGESSDSVYINGSGLYVLMVEEFVNHCKSTDTLIVDELQSTLVSFELTVVPECQGNLAGAIIFDTVINAETQLIYSIGLNGGSTNPVFDSLTMGDYVVSVIDSFGCALDSFVSITETSSETVDLGPDLDILIGDPALLIATLNIDSSALSSISWDPEMPCDSCLSNKVYLLETQSFTINVRDVVGCLAFDEVKVFVQERGQVYVPNIFTPNNDGINDFLTLNAHPGVTLVRQFRIVDRWGNQVFGVENTNPHTQKIEWDGRFNGKELNPAVYAYMLELELITGRIEIRSGDITLLR
jgi:gliding motility-associated-like protein